jgi:diguanylate cyclase (GGDEF)-like protein
MVNRRLELSTVIASRWLVVSFSFLLVAVVGVTGWKIKEAHNTAVSVATVSTENLAESIESSMVLTMQRVDDALVAASEKLRAHFESSSFSDAEIDAYLRTVEQRIPGLFSLMVADKNSFLSHGRPVNKAAEVSVADRHYFQALRRDPSLGLYISQPVSGILTNRPQIVLARRINCRDGMFCGVMIAPIELAEFINRFSDIQIGQRGIIMMTYKNSEILAAYSPLDSTSFEYQGTLAALKTLLPSADSDVNRVSFITDQLGDRVERFYTYLQLEDTPLNLIVGLSVYEWLKAWRRDSILEIAVVLSLLGLLAVGVIKSLKRIGLRDTLMTELAYVDSLTKIPNRRLFIDRVSQTILEVNRNELSSAVLFIDLDHFKPLNDKYGHDLGDRLLIEVANRIKQVIRAADTVARVGGDEFAVLLMQQCDHDHDDVLESDAVQVAEKIRHCLSLPYYLPISRKSGPAQSVTCSCSASIGVAFISAEDVDFQSILNRADAAMYKAKEQGKDTVEVCEDRRPELKVS